MIHLANNLSENQAGLLSQLNQTIRMYIGLFGLGVMFFGLIGYFVLVSKLYSKEKKRLSRLY